MTDPRDAARGTSPHDPPRIDHRVKYVGVSKLRVFNAQKLAALEDVLVIQDGDEPIRVLVPYKLFMRMQEAMNYEPR